MEKSNFYKIILALFIIFIITGTITSILIKKQLNNNKLSAGIINSKSKVYTEHWELPFTKDGNINIELSAINVKVEPYDGSEIIIDFTGYTTPNSKGIHPKLSISNTDQKINIKQTKQNPTSKFIFNFSPIFDTAESIQGQMVIQLPKNLNPNFDIELFSGEIDVSDYNFNNIAFSTSSGNILSKNISSSKDVNIHTFSGNLEATNIKAKKLSLQSSSGKITGDTLTSDSLSTNQFSGKLSLNNCNIQDTVTLETSSGNILIDKMNTSDFYAQTFSGNHQLNNITVSNSLYTESSSGKITSENIKAKNIEHVTFSGKITINNITADDIKTNTSSGDLIATILTPANLNCVSFSGKIDIEMPEYYEFNLNLNTFSGNSDIAYPIMLNKNENDKKSFSGIVGNGSYKVKFETSSGNISLKPLLKN